MAMKPIVELGVSEAYTILVNRLGEDRLPPLEAIENEDWGRDLLLGRFERTDGRRTRRAGPLFERTEVRSGRHSARSDRLRTINRDERGW